MDKTGLVVLNYNGGQDSIVCLRSLSAHVPSRHPILVLDNHSTDGSDRMIRDQFPTVEFIRLPKNEGFGAGMNRGFSWAVQKGLPSVILLNHDTVATEDFVTPLLANKAHLVGPVIGWHKEGELWYDSGGKILWPWGRPVHVQSIYRPPAFNRKVDYLPGACVLVRLTVFDAIGGFDPDYFLYFEDADFCMRAIRSGLKVAIEPKAYIMHRVSAATGGKTSPLTTYYVLRNNFHFIWKFGSPLAKLAGTSYLLVLSLLIALKLTTVKKRGPVLRAILAAWFDMLRGARGFRAGYP